MATTIKPKVKLVGEDGNVFSIMARCHKAARRDGWDEEAWKIVQDDMKSGDYDHALQVVMKFFDVF